MNLRCFADGGTSLFPGIHYARDGVKEPGRRKSFCPTLRSP
jgi:hypothetical protein